MVENFKQEEIFKNVSNNYAKVMLMVHEVRGTMEVDFKPTMEKIKEDFESFIHREEFDR